MLRRTLLSHPNARSFSSSTLSADENAAGRLRFYSRRATLLGTNLTTSLGLHERFPSKLPCLNRGNHFHNDVRYTQHRCFFFGSDGSGNNGNNSDDDNDDKKGKSENGKTGEEKKEDDESGSKEDGTKGEEDANSDDSIPSPSLNNSSKYKNSTHSQPSSSLPSNVLVPASRLGFGDQAPRYPHLLALPVIRGPVFPGVLVGQSFERG
jgi:hypothetical protein